MKYPLWIRYTILLPLLLSPILVPNIIWLICSVMIILKRIICYPKLYNITVQKLSDIIKLKDSIIKLSESIESNNTFEITSATCYEKNLLYIAIRKNNNKKLEKFDNILTLDRKDGKIMGLFQITEVKENEYYAEEKSNIDPLWKGYVKQNGEISMIPNIIAIYLKKEIQNG